MWLKMDRVMPPSQPNPHLNIVAWLLSQYLELTQVFAAMDKEL
jgi:hypothetical protein